MPTSRIVATVLIIGLGAVSAPGLVAQRSGGSAEWETLVRAPLPEEIEPIISVNGLTMPGQPVAAHSHAGPVVAYIVQGEIENQVEPDPPAIYKPGGVFFEAPRRVHKMMRNLGDEPARLIIVQAGRTGVPASLIKTLGSGPTKLFLPRFTQWQVPLPTMSNQELRLLRLTLAASAQVEVRAHSGPGLIYVLEGTISISGASAPPQACAAGDLLLDAADRAATITNTSGNEPAKLLLYQVDRP